MSPFRRLVYVTSSFHDEPIVFSSPTYKTSAPVLRGVYVATTVPDVPRGPYDVIVKVAGEASEPKPIEVVGLEDFSYTCAPTALFVFPKQPDTALCTSTAAMA